MLLKCQATFLSPSLMTKEVPSRIFCCCRTLGDALRCFSLTPKGLHRSELCRLESRIQLFADVLQQDPFPKLDSQPCLKQHLEQASTTQTGRYTKRNA